MSSKKFLTGCNTFLKFPQICFLSHKLFANYTKCDSISFLQCHTILVIGWCVFMNRQIAKGLLFIKPQCYIRAWGCSLIHQMNALLNFLLKWTIDVPDFGLHFSFICKHSLVLLSVWWADKSEQLAVFWNTWYNNLLECILNTGVIMTKTAVRFLSVCFIIQ